MADKFIFATGHRGGIRDETIAFWLRFYRYVTPVRRGAKAAQIVADATDELPRDGHVSGLSIASHMRRMRKRGRPFPVTAWRVARGIRTLSYSKWCAGPLFLFAAGYFGLFGKLLICVDDRVIPKKRRRQLSQSALQSVTVTTRAERIQAIEKSSDSEYVKKRALRQARDIDPEETDERYIWRLTASEDAAFEELLVALIPTYPPDSKYGHLKGAYPPLSFVNDANPDVVMCALAEEAQISLKMRQQIVITTLTRALS